MRFFTFAIFMLVYFSSCQSVILGAYGIKKPKELSLIKMDVLSNKVTRDAEYQYYIDSNYVVFLKSIDTTFDILVCNNEFNISKDLKQPLQVLFFDSTKKIEQLFTNCYAGGFPNLNWNNAINYMYSNPLDVSVKNTIYIDSLLKYVKPISVFEKKEINMNAKPIIILFWNGSMLRQSKRMIHKVLADYSKEYLVIFVNNDNFVTEIM